MGIIIIKSCIHAFISFNTLVCMHLQMSELCWSVFTYEYWRSKSFSHSSHTWVMLSHCIDTVLYIVSIKYFTSKQYKLWVITHMHMSILTVGTKFPQQLFLLNNQFFIFAKCCSREGTLYKQCGPAGKLIQSREANPSYTMTLSILQQFQEHGSLFTQILPQWT